MGTPKTTIKKIKIFINTCFKIPLRIRCPETISNTDLWQRTHQLPAEDGIKKEKKVGMDRAYASENPLLAQPEEVRHGSPKTSGKETDRGRPGAET